MKNFLKEITKSYIQKEKDILKKNNAYSKLVYKFIIENDTDIVEAYDTNGKSVFKATYEYIGTYIPNECIWFWAWNNPYVSRNLTKMTEQIHDYSKYIEKNYKLFDPQEIEEIYYFIKNGNFYAETKTIDLLVKISLYISKTEWFATVKKSENIDKIDYIFIKNIIQYK